VLFAVFGFLMKLAPLMLGFIIGPMMEKYLRRALLLSRSDPMVFVTSPISATMLAMSLIAMVMVLLPALRKKREEAFVE
jgi:TctA family transporter